MKIVFLQQNFNFFDKNSWYIHESQRILMENELHRPNSLFVLLLRFGNTLKCN